jgi:hypothetical protein
VSNRQFSNPTILFTVTTTDQVFSVSFSVKPLNLPTTQKPLSFIHDTNMAPKPIAMNLLSPRGTSGERGVPNGLLSPTLSSLWKEREKKLASG